MTGSNARAGGGAVPRTRQRIHKTPPPLEVPDIDEDAAERKRVLNVLAQRRYREKKRLARLKDKGPKSATTGLESSNSKAISPNTSRSDEDILPSAGQFVDTMAGMQPQTDEFSAMDDVEEIIRSSGDVNSWDVGLADSVPSFFTGMETLPNFGMMGDASWATMPSPDSMISPSFLESLTSVSPSSSNTNTIPSSNNSPSADEFVDNYHLPVHELTLLNALMRIATRIGSTENLWSLETISSFYLNMTSTYDSLPEVLRPTNAQIMIPHHPLIDFLPWPSVRDRLLAITALPAEARPPSAAGDLWFLNFVYDLEDNSEGVRINGGDPYDPESWEVGQKLFEGWWFVFDRRVVDRSNEWRKLRGAPLLTAKITTK